MTHGTVLTTLNFLCNLGMGRIDKIVSLNQFGKACKGQTLLLIGPIHKLCRK
jgi:hypothetical protein